MILYISGFQSTRKQYIQDSIKNKFPDQDVVYYVLENVFSKDLSNVMAICDANKEDVFIIGHSTGGFLGLCCYMECKNVIAVHMINPAIDLLWSLDKNPNAGVILKEREMIAKWVHKIGRFYDEPVKPICLYQGIYDDRVDMDYNRKFISLNGGNVYEYEIGHRFDQSQFEIILKDIFKYIKF